MVTWDILFIFVDRCEVQNRSVLENLQHRYLECIEYMLPVNHPGEVNLVAKVLQILVDLRTVTELILSGLRQISHVIDFKQYPIVHHVLFT